MRHLFPFLAPFLFVQTSLANHNWKNQIGDFKKIVVNIKIRAEMGLEFDVSGSFQASGFVVDPIQRIVATNRHVSQTGPATYELQFYNGAKSTAQLLYYDPWHDFAFLKYNPPSPLISIPKVKFSSHDQVRDNDEVCMVGNNEAESYSIKYGTVSKRFVNKLAEEFERHTHALLTSFDRAGGSSGSPVFNTDGEVVAMHKAGNNTSSYELRVDYITDALSYLIKNQVPPRGDLGLKLRTLPIASATRFYNLPQKEIDLFKKKNKDLQFVLQVERIIPQTESAIELKTGDILLSINNLPLGENLYLFDQTVNQNIGQKISLRVHRREGDKTVGLTPFNAETQKVNRFAHFAGTLFHEITPTLSLYFNIPMSGVFLAESDPGSSFDGVGIYRKSDPPGAIKKRRVLLVEGGGKPLMNLKDLSSLFSTLSPGSPLTLLYKDIGDFGVPNKNAEIELSANLTPLQFMKWDSKQLRWIQD